VNLTYSESLSHFAFDLSLRRYATADAMGSLPRLAALFELARVGEEDRFIPAVGPGSHCSPLAASSNAD
jgi:hypothetical protein